MPITRSVGRRAEIVSESASATATSATATSATATSATATSATTYGTEATDTTATRTTTEQEARTEPTVQETAAAPRSSTQLRSRQASVKSRKSKAHRLAKARSELIKLKIELASAKLAELEAEDSEEDVDSDITEVEQDHRVHNWLQDSQLLAIESRPHGTAQEEQTEPQPSAGTLVPEVIAGRWDDPVTAPAGATAEPPSLHLPAAQRTALNPPFLQIPTSQPPQVTNTRNQQPYSQETNKALVTQQPKTELQELASAITQAVQAAQHRQPLKYTELPNFNGAHQDWLTYRAAYFETAHHFSALENMSRLRRSLRGTAKEAVQGLLITNADPNAVMKTLEIRFGRPDSIAMAEIERLRTLPRLTDSPRDICTFSTKVENIVGTLQALDCAFYLYNPEVTKAMMEKLTPTLRRQWYEFAARQPKGEPDLQRFSRFIQKEAEICSPFAAPEIIHDKPFATTRVQEPLRRQRVHTAVVEKQTVTCSVCEQEGHRITDCSRFKNATTDTRWDLAKKLHLCFRCLRRRTKQHSCKSQKCEIDGCNHYHHKLLHSNRKDKSPEEVSVKEETVNSAWTPKMSFLKIAPVSISGPAGAVHTHALLDDGSTVTLIDEQLARDIGAEGPDEPLHIVTYDGEKNTRDGSRRVSFTIQGSRGKHHIEARTVDNLRLAAQRIPTDALRNCEHLKGIVSKNETEDTKPRILIGQDNWHLLLATKTRTGKREQPVASLTLLGWVVHGSRTRTLGHKVNFVGQTLDEDKTEELLKEFLAADNLYIDPRRPKNDPGEKALRSLERHTERTPEGRFRTALLWKSEEVKLPNNYADTLKRLHNIEKKLDKDPELKQKYSEQMGDLVRKGYAEPAPSLSHATRTWYLPHFAIDQREPKLKEALPDINRFSTWRRYLRATARVLQAVELLQKGHRERVHYKRTKGKRLADPDWRQKKPSEARHQANAPTRPDRFLILPAELQHRAEHLIIRASQENSFYEELKALRAGKPIARDSRLRPLSIKLTEDLIRLDSRISAAAGVSEAVKNPPILDGEHRATQLWINHIHQELHHAGAESTINYCRQHYWILRLRPIVKSLIRQCMKCRLRAASPPQPATGNLPPCRLAHHQRPFTFTGLDYFGPLTVTVGRSRQKRYVALFTCLTVRAIHLELVPSLSTESAIMALRRMIARRGCPAEIWSDNGTNFHGAEKELRHTLLAGAEQEASRRAIRWRFIPPGAPFMGGAWERLVRSVKTALTTVLHEKNPHEETLATLLAEVEYTVNSRPLTHVSVSPEDPEALTPNHLLLGSQGPLAAPSFPADHNFGPHANLRATQQLADSFWSRWLREYLPELRNRREPRSKGPELQVDDVVRIIDGNLPRNTWVRGRISATYPGPDGVVRTVDVATQGGTLRRPARKVVVVWPATPDSGGHDCDRTKNAEELQ